MLCFFLLQNCAHFKRPISDAERNKNIDSCFSMLDNIVKKHPDISEEALKDSCIAFFESMGDHTGEIVAIGNLGDWAKSKSNYSKALQFYFLSEQMALEEKDTGALINCKLGQADVYRALENKEKCLGAIHQMLGFSANYQANTNELSNRFINLAYYYQHFQEYDSAFIFLEKLKPVIPALDSDYYSSCIVADRLIRQQIFLSKYNTAVQKNSNPGTLSLLDSAESFYSKPIDSLSENIFMSAAWAELLLGQSQIDLIRGNTKKSPTLLKTSLALVREALAIAAYENDDELLMKTYQKFADIYLSNRSMSNMDSAVYYQQKISALQNAVIHEHAGLIMNNEEIFESSYFTSREENERKKKAQLTYLLVPPFIVFFIYGIILLGKMKVRERWIESLGLLATIMVFEFISLLLHGYLDRLTHENQLLILLSLVVIGILLEPLHNYFQKWLKQKLVVKEV